MYEELFRENESRIPTQHPQILVARSAHVDPSYMHPQIDNIGDLVARRDVAGLRAKFKELVPEYKPTSADEITLVQNRSFNAKSPRTQR